MPPGTRRSARGQHPNQNTTAAFEARTPAPTRGGVAPRGRRAGALQRGGKRSAAAANVPTPSRPQKRRSPDLFKMPAGTSIEAQMEKKLAELEFLKRLKAGRAALQEEGEGDDVGGNAEEMDEEDVCAYEEELARRRQMSSTAGAPRRHSNDGNPLSAEGLQREAAKKILQNNLRQRARETPNTFEAEEFMESEEIDFRTRRDVDLEYVVNPIVKVWLNKAPVLSESGKGDMRRSALAADGLDWVESMVLRAIEDRTGDEEYDFVSKLVLVRSTCGRGVNVPQSIDDFGSLALDKVINIADSQYLNYPRNWAVRVTFEIRATCSALTEQAKPRVDKRKVQDVDSPAATVDDGSRNDRTKMLKAQNMATRIDAYSKRADQISNLYNEWRCLEPGCPNFKNYCYYDNLAHPSLHFKLDGSDIDSWAYALERNEPAVTITVPSSFQKNRIVAKGPIVRNNSSSGKQSSYNKIKSKIEEQQEQYAEMQMMYRQAQMEDRMEAMRERMDAKEEERERRIERQRAEMEAQRQREALPYNTRSNIGLLPAQHNTAAYTFPQAHAPSIPVGVTSHTNTLTRSSPIDATEDDFDLVEAFFNWVIKKQKTEARQSDFLRAKEIATSNYWTIDDLKAMEMPSSHLYKVATGEDCKIPDGIVRSFRRYVRQFKAEYREHKSAAALLEMQLSGGGFLRGDQMQ